MNKPRFGQRRPPTVLDPDTILVRGAHQHNLRHVDVTIPRYKLVVLTGLSGSGKSSLAFDTIFAEGQRRYVESLSAYARQYIEQMEKPKVEFIAGLSPTIAIEQKTVSKNPRSNVGTITEIINYLRLLYSRLGLPHCLHCGHATNMYSAQAIANELAALHVGMEIILRVADEAGEYCNTSLRVPDNCDQFRAELLTIAKRALKVGGGKIVVTIDGQDRWYGDHWVCPRDGQDFPWLMSAHFSPNTPYGMCPHCNGLGYSLEIDPNLIVDQPQLSLLDGASRWYGNLRRKNKGKYWALNLESLAEYYNVDLELPWRDLPQYFRDVILYGSGDEKIKIMHQSEWDEGSFQGESVQTIKGLMYHIDRSYRQTKSDGSKRYYASFMSQQPCLVCGGTRLCKEALAVTLGGKRITEVGTMTIAECLAWLEALHDSLPSDLLPIGEDALHEVGDRLQFMINVGLHYLTLDRPAPTLSGGEGQRIRLASQIGSGLVGVMYILDEPSIGLHPRDNRTLIDTLRQLRDMGNTVLVVEHDAEMIRSADWIIDMGPGAGVLGGTVIAEGKPHELAHNPQSITGRYLNGQDFVRVPTVQRRKPDHRWLTLRGAQLHNLKNITARFPIGLLTCVTGVSGSGKSSLIAGILYPALQQALHGTVVKAGLHEKLEGTEHLSKVITITQDPIGRTPRSNPATYVGILDQIRHIFADTDDARAKGFDAGHFSFNVEGGRCETCQGYGQRRVEMHFMPDVWVPCSDCEGTRFNEQTCSIRFGGKNIADVLNMDVQEAVQFFAGYHKAERILQTLHDVGLDYIKLGQSATTLSGGEAQRIKLARELSRVTTGRTIYILDEPTTGLHFADIQRLLDVLHRLVDAGNTVIVIEHNLDVIKTADWIIDLGPDGGDAGGTIVAGGAPEVVMQVSASYTGQFLREVFEGLI